MSIDSVSAPSQRINDLVAQQTREVPGERENDGDSDDKGRTMARTSAPQQLNPQGVGTKIDLMA